MTVGARECSLSIIFKYAVLSVYQGTSNNCLSMKSFFIPFHLPLGSLQWLHGTLSNTLISLTLVLALLWGHLVGAAILAKKDDGP